MVPPSDGWGADLGSGGGWDAPNTKPAVKKKAGGWASGIVKNNAPKIEALAPAQKSVEHAARPEARPVSSESKPAATVSKSPTRGGPGDNTIDNFGGVSHDAGGSETCRYCRKAGHFARECPDKPANDGGCFNCGEQGHNKMECPNPRKFSGECRSCGQEGHSVRECPESVCSKCQKKGHARKECTGQQLVNLSFVKVRDPESAWNDLVKASDEDDIDDFKIHMLEYLKSNPGISFADMERAFRGSNLRFYIFALSLDEVSYSKILIGPNGESGVKYVWCLNRSVKPRRSKALSGRLAETPEENLIRLEKAGFLEDYLGDYCRKCKTKDHATTGCDVEVETEQLGMEGLLKVAVKCTNCEAFTHRLRDCPEPRKAEHNSSLCRNCQQEGHKASDCENPRVAGPDTECRKCNGNGHFAADCPDAPKQCCFNCGQDGHRSSECTNEKVPKCRNCDEYGHMSKECSKPRDMMRVKCNNCDEMGHYSTKCPNPKKEEEAASDTAEPEVQVPKFAKKTGGWAAKAKKATVEDASDAACGGAMW